MFSQIRQQFQRTIRFHIRVWQFSITTNYRNAQLSYNVLRYVHLLRFCAVVTAINIILLVYSYYHPTVSGLFCLAQSVRLDMTAFINLICKSMKNYTKKVTIVKSHVRRVGGKAILVKPHIRRS